MIEYDGPGPVRKEDAELKPASGFELLRARALRSMRGESARLSLGRDLYWALRELDAPKARKLILAGAPMEALEDAGRGMSWEAPLTVAAVARGPFGLSAVRLLLSAGADPDAWLESSHRPPATLALMSGQWASAQAILRSSKEPLAKAPDGVGPRLAAAIGLGKAGISESARIFGDKDSTLELLRELGADPNERLETSVFGRPGSTPLSFVARMQGAVAELIEAGADVNAQDAKGVSALMIAAGWQAAEPVKKLLAAGANPRALDHEGRDALDWLIHTEQKLSQTRGGRWGEQSEPIAMALLEAGLERLKRSRLKGLKFEGGDNAPEWLERVRVQEERLELSAQVQEEAPKAARSARL